MNTSYRDELIIRADDIEDSELLDLYVDLNENNDILKYLTNKIPVLLVGSRGSGKTMLLRVAEKILEKDFERDRILPVFITFKEAGLIKDNYFKQWMLSKILFQLRRKLVRLCNMQTGINVVKDFFDIHFDEENINSKIDRFNRLLQKIWKNKKVDVKQEIKEIFNKDVEDIDILNEIDYFNALIEDICNEFNIKRIVFLFDEACHNFIPSQQRIFFTLFRDIRSQYVNCKAAVYPGIVSYGETFQKFHDATEIKIERKITDENYIESMRKMIRKQVDEKVYNRLEENGELLDLLIYSSSGNPRTLLRSLIAATKNLAAPLRRQSVTETIKEFYRNDIWNEHILLSEKYVRYKDLIDWGREFLENRVIEDINTKFNSENKNKTIYFAVDRDAPQAVKQSMKILEHSGIISLHKEGVKKVASRRSRFFDRYQINLGIILVSEKDSNPVAQYNDIVKGLSIENCTNYTMNSPAFSEVKKYNLIEGNEEIEEVLDRLLNKPIDVLEISEKQKDKLKNAGYISIGDVINATEDELKKIKSIGDIRARRISNTARNAAIEYICG